MGLSQINATGHVRRPRPVFDWAHVPEQLARDLLVARLREQGERRAAAEVKEYSRRRVNSELRKQLGGPSTFEGRPTSVVLDWLTRPGPGAAGDLTAIKVAGELHLLRPTPRHPITTAAQARRLLREFRNDAGPSDPEVRTIVVRHFKRAHKKTPRDVTPRPPKPTKARASRPRLVLEGANEAGLKLHEHQLAAHRALDALDRTKRRRSAGHGWSTILELPTGAGKTRTAVEWVLDRLEAEPNTKVLWIAHQQELLDQAAAEMERVAATRPTNLRMTGRIVHSNGHTVPSVGPHDRVLLGSVQTLARATTGVSRRVIDDFVGSDTFVIVDEAHHAGAPTYHALLDRLRQCCRGMIGLTATPWPSGQESRRKFDRLFGTKPAVSVTIGELTSQGVLARPILHTIDTGHEFALTDAEVSEVARRHDLPEKLLTRLAGARDDTVARLWLESAEKWGATLVFAPRIASADRIAGMIRQGGKFEAKAIHSESAEEREDVLAWFRSSSGPRALVSVGMLNEGVDLPNAETAFLARPTTSRILMRQMVGRVLRGPQSGGGETANVVYLRDQWTNFSDLLEPPDEFPGIESEGGSETSRIVLRRDDDREDVPQSVIDRAIRDLRTAIDLHDFDSTISTANLHGYFEVDGRLVPVFDNQLDGYRRMKRNAGGVPLFDDLAEPSPSKRAVGMVQEWVDEFDELPPLRVVSAACDPLTVAHLLRARGPMTTDEQYEWIRERWETSLAFVLYPSFDHYYELVLGEVRRIFSRARRLESAPMPPLPALRRNSRRTLDGPKKIALAELAKLPDRYRDRIDRKVDIDWTRTEISTAFAHWSLRSSRNDSAKQTIRVNALLKAPKSQISDELLGYLVYHEYLHGILPGHGHDALFRDFEGRFPDAVKHDHLLDTLRERKDIGRLRETSGAGGSTGSHISR